MEDKYLKESHLLLSRYDIDSLIEYVQSKPEYKNIAVQFDERLEGKLSNI